MAISLTACILLLKEHHLLKSSAVQSDVNVEMTGISYDSRKVEGPTLFFCKGDKFRPIYLSMAKDSGATTYVAEKPYVEGNGLNALIVVNITKAMAILSAAFYDFPQDDLEVIAYTGTKGKTTAAYFTRGILEAAHPHHVALFSTIDRIVGPNPDQRFKSDLSTPESMDLFHDMREAVNNGMTHLVMEVSSQAYLRNRVFGLTYDIGFFLNITPNHIGPSEHPNFANYLHNKVQLLVNSRRVVINAETDHFDAVYAAARTTTYADSIYLFASTDFQPQDPDLPIDFRYEQVEADLEISKFRLVPVTDKAVELNIGGQYQLGLVGDFNVSNATAAIIGAGLTGIDATKAAAGIANVAVPGRMESVTVPNHGHVFVDDAHSYASLHTLLGYMHSEYQPARLRVVLGAPGGKGVDLRADFARALNEHATDVYLTTDDPEFEDPAAIVDQVDEQIDHDRVVVHKVLDRRAAIHAAISDSQPNDIVLITGKGEEASQRVRGVDAEWPSDIVVTNQEAAKLGQSNA